MTPASVRSCFFAPWVTNSFTVIIVDGLSNERDSTDGLIAGTLLGGEYIWAKTCNLWITPHLDFHQHLACISRAGCNELIVTDFQLSALGCDDGVEMDCETWR